VPEKDEVVVRFTNGDVVTSDYDDYGGGAGNCEHRRSNGRRKIQMCSPKMY
jgi:hypothetical protein